jgi:hypothetical protein
MSINLADLYHAANIPTSADDFALRQTAFEGVAASLTQKQIIDCGRMYFDWWEKIAEFDWFLAAFRNDPRFSLTGNRRESSVLAGALLFNAVKEGNAFAGLVVLTTCVQGKRQPGVPGLPFEVFETQLRNHALEGSEPHGYNTAFKPLGRTSVTKEKLVEDSTLPTLATGVITALTETSNATQASLTALQATVSSIAADLAAAREQLSILWWLTGGWSRRLKRSFETVGAPLAFIAAGFDLADLSGTVSGPYAAEAILSRVLLPFKKLKKPIAFSEIGDSPTDVDFALLEMSDVAKVYPDICPLSAALMKSAEIGRGASWHLAFVKAAHLSVTTALLPQEIAVQAMYERLLMSNL